MRNATELSSPLFPQVDQTFSAGDYERSIPAPTKKDNEEFREGTNEQIGGWGVTRSEAPELLEFQVIAEVFYPNDRQGSEKALDVFAKIEGIGVAGEAEASSINDQTKTEAKEVVLGLSHQHRLYISEAYPMENGGIELEESNRYWDLGIWVEPTGVVSYVISGPGLERTSGQGNAQEVISEIWNTITG